MTLHVCFDIDGTLCEVGEYCVFDDPESIAKHTRPFPGVMRKVRDLIEAGAVVSFVTGRSEDCAAVTRRQIAAWLDRPNARGLDIEHRPRGAYDVVSCMAYKMDMLRMLKPAVYVGDLPMDQTAAAAAGVRFMPAEWFRKGLGLSHIADPNFDAETLREWVTPFFVTVAGVAPGVYDCRCCGNRVRTLANVVPAVCDGCEKPGPWAAVVQNPATPDERLSETGREILVQKVESEQRVA